jgi:hypothetical protein
MAVTHPTAFRNTVADLVDSSLGAGANLVFRTAGNANAPGAEVATLAMSNPAFGAASGGSMNANAITEDGDATGNVSPVATATLETSGGTVIVHCQVAASGQDIDFTGGLTVGAGDTVACSELSYTAMP